MRKFFRRYGLFMFVFAIIAGPRLQAADLSAIEKTIGKEPAYHGVPRYCLLVFGADAKTKVWIVEDERTLYVDRNANGDLTDDGPPLQPTEFRRLDPRKWDYDYLLNTIKPTTGPLITNFRLRRWNYGEKNDSYGLSLMLPDDKRPLEITGQFEMYAGWFGEFWADSPATASLLHFGGSLEPRLLRGKEFVLGGESRRLSFCFQTPGSGAAGPTRLSEEAIPVLPPIIARIEWPVSPGSPRLVTTHDLSQHCCYWEYYDSTFRVPQNAGIIEGNAIVTIDLPEQKFPLPLRTNKIEVPVKKSTEAKPVASVKPADDI